MVYQLIIKMPIMKIQNFGNSSQSVNNIADVMKEDFFNSGPFLLIGKILQEQKNEPLIVNGDSRRVNL